MDARFDWLIFLHDNRVCPEVRDETCNCVQDFSWHRLENQHQPLFPTSGYAREGDLTSNAPKWTRGHEVTSASTIGDRVVKTEYGVYDECFSFISSRSEHLALTRRLLCIVYPLKTRPTDRRQG
jgi:hypothetical protein